MIKKNTKFDSNRMREFEWIMTKHLEVSKFLYDRLRQCSRLAQFHTKAINNIHQRCREK